MVDWLVQGLALAGVGTQTWLCMIVFSKNTVRPILSAFLCLSCPSKSLSSLRPVIGPSTLLRPAYRASALEWCLNVTLNSMLLIGRLMC